MNEKLIELVKSSDMPNVKKLMTIGFIERANESEENNRRDRKLIEDIAGEKGAVETLLCNEDVIIYKIFSKDDWGLDYPFRMIYKNSDGRWHRISTVAPSFDVAYLIYLEHKYLGLNSQFSLFASKMLNI